jgi:hypothetical protein
VCSSEGGTISEVISAIDQLAEDAEAGLATHELSSRVAAIWAMLAALDPEMARLRAAYEHPGRELAGRSVPSRRPGPAPRAGAHPAVAWRRRTWPTAGRKACLAVRRGAEVWA